MSIRVLQGNFLNLYSYDRHISVLSFECIFLRFYGIGKQQDRDEYRNIQLPGIDFQGNFFDYFRSGFDAAYAIPFGDVSSTVGRSQLSCSYPNIFPMWSGLNRGPWASIEGQGRLFGRRVYYSTRHRGYDGRVFALTGCGLKR